MKPNKQKQTDFEKVSTADFVVGKIIEIQRDENHKSTWEGKEKIQDCIRFKFEIEGCQFPHYSKWMLFFYGEQTNLYQKFLLPLVDNANPEMDFELENLVGIPIKMLWAEKGDFQYPETVRPVGGKINSTTSISENPPPTDDDLPF